MRKLVFRCRGKELKYMRAAMKIGAVILCAITLYGCAGTNTVPTTVTQTEMTQMQYTTTGEPEITEGTAIPHGDLLLTVNAEETAKYEDSIIADGVPTADVNRSGKFKVRITADTEIVSDGKTATVSDLKDGQTVAVTYTGRIYQGFPSVVEATRVEVFEFPDKVSRDEFSYTEDEAKIQDESVRKSKSFVNNMNGCQVTDAKNAILRAWNEGGSDYDKATVALDNGAHVWRVSFFNEGEEPENGLLIYISANGQTLMKIIPAETAENSF